jgi:hypothetical protein
MATSDAFDQYTQDGAHRFDLLAERQRIAGQYTTDVPKTTLGDYSYEAPGKRPPVQPRSVHWWLSSPGAPPAGESLGTPLGGRGRPYQVDVDQPPGQAPGPPERPQPEEGRTLGSGRDFDDGDAPPITGGSGGWPVQGPRVPRPSGLGGGVVLPIPDPIRNPYR